LDPNGTGRDGNLFVGIDLGGEKKRTTGLCILSARNDLTEPHDCANCQLINSQQIIATIEPYVKRIRVIAIDGPLTVGRGKGAMRLYEKFLSTKIFRQHRVQPLPPALMPEIVWIGINLARELEKFGFVLDENLIEVFPTLTKELCKQPVDFACPSSHQKSASICGWQAWLHWQGKTRFLGHRDGRLFVPEPSLWKERWQRDFEQAWRERDRLRYRYLKTNIFE
jgi:predicted nuclease with RNAse H fold